MTIQEIRAALEAAGPAIRATAAASQQTARRDDDRDRAIAVLIDARTRIDRINAKAA